MTRLTPDQWIAQLDLPEIYRVGGSVRDELLGRQSKDSDYMVRGAEPSKIGSELAHYGGKVSPLKLRGNGPTIGMRASVKGLGLIEVVLPRVERSTGSGRHAFDIEVGPDISIEADAHRRDFTINALYKDVRTGEIHDPLGGLNDLGKRLIACCSENSFAEDPLRMLRALRFLSKLQGFDLTSGCYKQMLYHAGAVTGLTQKGVSGTALDELGGILMGLNPGYALELAASSHVLQTLLPELEPMIGFEQRSRYHEKTTSQHTFDAVQAAAAMHNHAPLRVRMALLFHDSGKPKMAWIGKDGLQHYYALSPKLAVELGASVYALEPHEHWGARNAEAALHRLNAPKRLRQDVVTLVERHMLPLHENTRPFKVRKWRAELGDDLLRDLITHRLADVLGKGGDVTEATEVLTWIANEQQRAIDTGVPMSAKELKINGNALKSLGASGREIGEIQAALLHEVIAQPKLNDHEWLAVRADKLMREKA